MHEADREAGVQRAAVGLLERRPRRRVQQVARLVRARPGRQVLQATAVCNIIRMANIYARLVIAGTLLG
jgi:hypothetical protein